MTKPAKPTTNVKRIAVDAIESFPFLMTPETRKGERCKDPTACSIAQSMKFKFR